MITFLCEWNQPLDGMYETHATKIRDGIAQLRRRLLEISMIVQDVVKKKFCSTY